MNSKYPFFKYITGNSLIHLMNSKMKIIWFLVTFLAIVLINDYLSLLLFILFLTFIMERTKINFMDYLYNVLSFWVIYFIFFIIMFLISIDVNLAIINSVKLILIVILFLILTFTTSLSEIAWGFECAFLKLKKINVPVSKISLRIAMDIKFISTIFEEAKAIRKSMAYRGIPYKNGLSSFKRMIVPVISISYKTSRRMVKVMKLRFYGNKKRTNYHENKISKFDKWLVLIPFVLLYLTIWLGWC